MAVSSIGKITKRDGKTFAKDLSNTRGGYAGRIKSSSIRPGSGATVTNQNVKDTIRNRNMGTSTSTGFSGYTQDNKIANNMVDQGLLPQAQKEIYPQASMPKVGLDQYKTSQDLYGGKTLERLKQSTEIQRPELIEPISFTDEEGYIGEAKQTQEDRIREKIREEEQGKIYEETKLDVIQGGKTIEQIRQEQEYTGKQRDFQKQAEQYEENIEQAKASTRMIEAQRQMSNLKHNLNYLNSGGRGQSTKALDAADRQLVEAAQIYDNMLEIESNVVKMRALGREINAEQYAKNMQDLQDKLDRQVNQSIQEIFNQMSADEIAGKLDSMEEVNKMTEVYLDSIDRSVEGITLRNIQQRQILMDQYTDLLQQAKDYETNKNTFSVHPAGYWIDGNGDQVISANTGQAIMAPKQAPFAPQILDDGTVLMYSYDDQGNIVVNTDQVLDIDRIESGTISNIVDNVLKGNIDIDRALELVGSQNQNTFWKQMAFQQQVPQAGGPLQDLSVERGNAIPNTGNVGNDLNNPGNLVRGGVGDQYAIGYVTVTGNDGVTRDFLVFPSKEAGYMGVQADLEAKMQGRSSVIAPTASLDQLLDVWVGGEGASTGYKQAVVDVTGYDLSAPINTLDAGTVLNGIKRAEGVSFPGHDFSGLGAVDQVGGLSPIAQAVIDGSIEEDAIKDNVEDKSQVPAILAEIQAYRRMQTETGDIDIMTRQMLNDLVYLRDEGGGRFVEWLIGGIPYTKSKDDHKTFKFVTDFLTMENLLDLKNRGATFGALSNEELQMIANSATKLSQANTEGEWDREINAIIERLTQGDERMKQFINSGTVAPQTNLATGNQGWQQQQQAGSTDEGVDKALQFLETL